MKHAAIPVQATAGGRDWRLDFFRGLSLFFIFVDHIPENLLSYFTLHSVAFCDAAEVFIFISGYTAALVYTQSLRRTGALYAVAQVYRRVWQLYVAHIFLFVIFVAEVSYTLLVVANPMYTEELGIGDFLQRPHLAVIRALMLNFQPPFLDILPLYIVLLAAFPVILFGLELNPFLPGLLSAMLYILTLSQGWALHTYPANHVWFFNPLAWQFLFVIGASLGHARAVGRALPRLPSWAPWLGLGLAAAFAIINLSWVAHWIYDPFPPLFLKLWNQVVDKTDLAPLRLLNFLVLAFATVQLVPRDSAFLRSRLLRPIILCGQHSLYVFCLGILLSVLGHFVLSETSTRFGMQAAVNLIGMALMIGTAGLLEWYKAASRPRPRPAAMVTAVPPEARR